MKASENPLVGDKNWCFHQPNLGFRTKYVATDDKSGERVIRSTSHATSCRENLIHAIRQGLQSGLCQKVRTGKSEWDFVFKQIKSVDLSDSATKEAGANAMKLNWDGLNDCGNKKKLVLIDFVRVVDTVMGPMCVLLASSRPEGEWWRTPEEEILKKDFLYWWGSDNFFLQHPVLASIVSGLYRQAALLYRAGYEDRIMGSVDYKDIEDCLSTGSKQHALEILRKTRPWIEVPPGKDGYVANYPFPQGYWTRMHRLQIGARRHGYEKILNQNFSEGWDLEAKKTHWTGLYSFWGEKGEYTDAHTRLMDLGRPKSLGKGGKKSEKESAPRDTGA